MSLAVTLDAHPADAAAKPDGDGLIGQALRDHRCHVAYRD
jgi:hypothetical protein